MRRYPVELARPPLYLCTPDSLVDWHAVEKYKAVEAQPQAEAAGPAAQPAAQESRKLFERYLRYLHAQPTDMPGFLYEALKPLRYCKDRHPIAVCLAKVALSCVGPFGFRMTAQAAVEQLAEFKDGVEGGAGNGGRGGATTCTCSCNG